MLQDLTLDVTSGLGGASEHRGAADYEGTGHVLAGHVLDKVIESTENARVFVRRFYESVAFLLEDRRRAVNCWVYQSDDLETGTEFAGGR